MEKPINGYFLVKSLGCKVNFYEAEALGNELEKLNLAFFDEKNGDPDEVKVVVLNSCCVTKTSEKKGRNLIRRLRKTYKNACLVVMGCLSSLKFEKIKEEDICDILVGTENRDKVIEYIKNYLENNEKIEIKDNGNEKQYREVKLNHYFNRERAFIKIQDGCDNFCSYCIIPFIRGRSRSREKDDIIHEISELVKNGYKEVVLTGIDISSYGKDFDYAYNFSDLLEDILENNKELYRLRISSIEESNLDDKFMKLLENNRVIASHLHIPLQSGSKDILLKMRRKYNIEEFIKKVDYIRQIRPDISLTTDVIVGFPSETEENFQETINAIERIKFNKVHVFPYSPREGTLASKMKEQISDEVKKERVDILLNLSSKLEKEYEEKFKGKEMEFLFEQKKNGYYIGHSSNFLEIKVKSDNDLTGKIEKYRY